MKRARPLTRRDAIVEALERDAGDWFDYTGILHATGIDDDDDGISVLVGLCDALADAGRIERVARHGGRYWRSAPVLELTPLELVEWPTLADGGAYGYTWAIGGNGAGGYHWEVTAFCGSLVDYGDADSYAAAHAAARKAARTECEG